MAHKTSLATPLFIEVPVTSQESEWSRVFVLGVSILHLSTLLLLDFGTVPAKCYLFVLHFISITRKNREKFEDIKGVIRSRKSERTDNAIVKKKQDKQYTDK